MISESCTIELAVRLAPELTWVMPVPVITPARWAAAEIDSVPALLMAKPADVALPATPANSRVAAAATVIPLVLRIEPVTSKPPASTSVPPLYVFAPMSARMPAPFLESDPLVVASRKTASIVPVRPASILKAWVPVAQVSERDC